jgi:hypothetical protein
MGNEYLSLREKTELEAQRISRQYGFTIEVARGLVKEYVFLKKNEEEINNHRQEKLETERRLKRLREKIKDVQRHEFEIKESEYDHIRNVLTKKAKDEFFGVLNITQKMDMSQKEPTKLEKKFQLYRLQTEERVLDYLREHFYRSNDYLMNVLKGKTISIQKVILNSGISVVDVFWEFDTGAAYQQYSRLPRQSIEEAELTSDQLEKYCHRRVQFKMMRDMGFKRMIEIRFHFSLAYQAEKRLEEDTRNNLYEIAQEMLEEEVVNKGRDPKTILPSEIKHKMETLEAKLGHRIAESVDYKGMRMRRLERAQEREKREEKLRERQGRTHGKSASVEKKPEPKKQEEKPSGKKKKPVFDSQGKRVRDNRNPDGSKKKYLRKNAGKEFWDSLEKR